MKTMKKSKVSEGTHTKPSACKSSKATTSVAAKHTMKKSYAAITSREHLIDLLRRFARQEPPFDNPASDN